MSSPRSWITVVSGLPRSGTSMMMQMIDAGGVKALTDATRAADDDNPRGYYELEAVKRTRVDPSWVPGAAGRCVKLVHLLLMDLPTGFEYRVVFMRRAMRQVLASQDKMLKRLGRPGAQVPAEQLAKVYQQQLDKVDAWLAQQRHFRVLRVDYGQVVGTTIASESADVGPTATAAKVNAFLGGDLDESAMARAVDPSLFRHRH